MELSTIGRENYPGLELQYRFNRHEEVIPDTGIGSRLRIILVEEGSGVIRIGDCTEIFTSPVAFCVNEEEKPVLEKSIGFKARAVYFAPNMINSKFNFKSIREMGMDFSQTELDDLYKFRMFTERNPSYSGRLNLNAVILKQLSRLFDRIDLELEEQRDWYWPCRSRSYLLEVIFLLEKIFMEPEAPGEIILERTSGDISEIILYFNTHYMEKITIEDLTRVFHVNRTTLGERFLRETGLPVMTYLIKLRVNLACMILRDTSVPITEVMERVGFKDDAHFGRMFRKHTGYSPTEYRQRFCWMVS